MEARQKWKTASTEIARGNEEVVALALRELSLSRGDQEGLADFLTDYVGSAQSEELGHYNMLTLLLIIISSHNLTEY